MSEDAFQLFYYRGFHAISANFDAVGVYLPVPKKNSIALLWTAFMHENDLEPQIAAP